MIQQWRFAASIVEPKAIPSASTTCLHCIFSVFTQLRPIWTGTGLPKSVPMCEVSYQAGKACVCRRSPFELIYRQRLECFSVKAQAEKPYRTDLKCNIVIYAPQSKRIRLLVADVTQSPAAHLCTVRDIQIPKHASPPSLYASSFHAHTYATRPHQPKRFLITPHHICALQPTLRTTSSEHAKPTHLQAQCSAFCSSATAVRLPAAAGPQHGSPHSDCDSQSCLSSRLAPHSAPSRCLCHVLAPRAA